MSTPSVPAVPLHDWFRREALDRLLDVVGGPARLRVIVLLAGVLGLSSADTATVGALAAELEKSLHIGNTDIGLLVTVSTGIGAVATLPFGALADRVNRTRLLWISVLVWSAAMIATGASTSFTMLLLTRLALGVVLATAGPVVASLTGDLFPAAERGRIYGYMLTGELIGTGFGFVISGDLAGLVSWRLGFWWLAGPSLALAWAIRRFLPEPARSGQSQLQEGDEEILSAAEADAEPDGRAPSDDPSAEPDEGELQQVIVEEGVRPVERLVLHTDPARRSLWWAVRYVLSIRTNRILIAASSLGYFFLQGLETFAVVFVRGRFGLGQSAASSLLVLVGVGAIGGVLVAGQLGDRLIRSHHLAARPVVAGASFLIAAALFLPGLLATSLLVAVPLFFLGSAALGGVNSPLDAARLDLMHSRLWGRAESVRTAVRTALQAIAPLLFGFVSTEFGAHTTGYGHPTGTASGNALADTFLIMLVPLIGAGLLLLTRARRSYPRDVATAVASERATATAPR